MDRKDYILRIYNLAVLRGLCKTRKEFAALLGINDKSLSAALNGRTKALTASLEYKVRLFAQDHNLEDEARPQPEPAAPPQERGVFIPEACRQMFDNMTETIKLQARLLDRLQGGDVHERAVDSLPTQKNWSHK